MYYSVWKEIALNQTNNRKDFRVWDYPIKEEYGQILAAIERTGTVPNRTVGFQMVSAYDLPNIMHIKNCLSMGGKDARKIVPRTIERIVKNNNNNGLVRYTYLVSNRSNKSLIFVYECFSLSSQWPDERKK